MQSSAIVFGAAARALAGEARRLGLVMPAFRSPPRSPTVRRAIKRWPDGGVVVVVRVRGRPVPRVVADMVDGVLAANRVTGARAEALRPELLSAVGEALHGRDRAA